MDLRAVHRVRYANLYLGMGGLAKPTMQARLRIAVVLTYPSRTCHGLERVLTLHPAVLRGSAQLFTESGMLIGILAWVAL